MFSLQSVSDGKPDHPMFDLAEAARLLDALPEDDPFKALDDITAWLTSVKDTPSFRPEMRTPVIMLLDETGMPLHTELMKLYLGEPRSGNPEGTRIWKQLHAFKKTLAEAYAACVNDYQRTREAPPGFREIMPAVCVRLLRAAAEQMKLELMHHVDIEQSVWDRLFECYNFSEAGQFADTMIFAYPKHGLHISPQRELVRAMMLYLSAPDKLAPEQIELSFRVAGRFSGFFDFKDAPDPDCLFCIDLSRPCAPMRIDGSLQTTPSMRFFGAARATPKLADIIGQHEKGVVMWEQRFGSEFTPERKISVLRHLQSHWAKP
jgi:hypothetical protein